MDEKLRSALMRETQPVPEAAFEGAALELASLTVDAEAVAVSAAGAAPAPYGLDPTGDFDVASVQASHVRALEQHLVEDPDAVLEAARQLWDTKITEDELFLLTGLRIILINSIFVI